MVERSVIQPLLQYEGEWGELVEKSCLSTIDFSKQEKMQDAMVQLTSGNAVLFLEGVSHCISISSKKLPLRGVGEVEKENSMRGPRDCFDEGLRTSPCNEPPECRSCRFAAYSKRARSLQS